MSEAPKIEERYGVMLLQLGTPASPSEEDVRAFLKVFLGDPRVVDLNPFFWKIILNLFILPRRPKVVAKAYEEIWDGSAFPLASHSLAYAQNLEAEMQARGHENTTVRWAAMIGEPSCAAVMDELVNEGCTRIRVIPQFPQYSEATTISAWDVLDKALEARPLPPGVQLEQVQHFEANPAFIHTLAELCREVIERDQPEKLLLSFHGYPLRRIFDGDPYFGHCGTTAERLGEVLEKYFPPQDILVCFQSQFGKEQWLGPSTEEVLMDLAGQGVKRVAVACPAFTVDCLETDEEIGIGLQEAYLEAGGESFTKIDAPNAHPTWVKESATHLLEAPLEEIPVMEPGSIPVEIPKQEWKVPPIEPEGKKALKATFLVLFIDLMGFSIIFPLFPRMLQFYGSVEGDSGWFGAMMSLIHGLESMLGGSSASHIVLFGGILGSIYSFLQFVCAPLLGTLSDRYGRRPVLITSLVGIAISYLLWFFSGSFALLVISRLLGGIMSGNISTATAVVADVTKPSNRSKGMALIGIAFGLGFLLGPALGAMASLFNPIDVWPALQAYGVNPFSGAALLAFGLSVLNLVVVWRSFPETHPQENRGRAAATRSINPLKLFAVESYPGVSLNNFVYFLFLLAFSGMEFTLTFLTFERLNYSNLDQGWMFVFIGMVLILMQGGYVRRKAALVGERKMAFQGLVTLIPGLAILGFAHTGWVLYLGLLLMGMGSAQIIPCLTTLVSQYTPPEEQGRVVGVFRSLGSLARAIGPLLACGLYWKLGADAFYVAGAIFLILPLVLVRRLPAPPHHGAAA